MERLEVDVREVLWGSGHMQEGLCAATSHTNTHTSTQINEVITVSAANCLGGSLTSQKIM